MRNLPPAGYIDAAWWEVYGARLRAEPMTRAAWVDALALAWQLVRIPESLSPAQREIQDDMTGRLTGRTFLPTFPQLLRFPAVVSHLFR